MSYEEMMQRLTEITRRLENEQLPLAEATALYTEGRRLSDECHAILNKAVLTVEELTVPENGGTNHV